MMEKVVVEKKDPIPTSNFSSAITSSSSSFLPQSSDWNLLKKRNDGKIRFEEKAGQVKPKGRTGRSEPDWNLLGVSFLTLNSQSASSELMVLK